MTRAVYDDLAPRYEAAMRPLERWFLTRWRAETLKHLPEKGRILEVGAGTGLNFRFYPREAHCVASDLSCEMLRIAVRKPNPNGLVLVQNEAETLPFKDGSFEAGLATLVFCSVASPQAAFAELRRVIKPGGTIVLLEHVRPPGLLGPLFDLLSCVTAKLCSDHVNRRTADNARAAGLRVELLEPRFLGIFNLIVCRN
ncbi:MAG: methyltransferase domain-containing protein [Acidobacteriota bacterium]|nr:methyltransferase domain-containing protein [Acidobacteriota bacterium]